NLLAPLKLPGVDARVVEKPEPPGANSVDLVLDGIDGAPIAHLVVAVSDAALLRTLSEVALATAALAAAALAAAHLLGLLVSRRMTRDLDALMGGVQAVARGELEVTVRARGRDEIGRVAEAFNVMTRDLRDAKERLLQAERVAAWQDIARSIAHEIK